MKETKKFLIFAIITLIIYIGNLIKTIIVGASLCSNIVAWSCGIIWLSIYAIEHYLQLKQIEKEIDEEFVIEEEIDEKTNR